jgi:chromosomal replication initiator protein
MPELYAKHWNEILELIGARVSKDTMDRWFSHLAVKDLTDDQIVISAPNQIYQFWIETNYLPILTEAVETVVGNRRRLAFQFDQKDPLDAVTPTDEEVSVVKKRPRRATKAKKSTEERIAEAGLNQRYHFGSVVVGTNNEFAHAACKAVAAKPGMTYNPLFIYGGAGLGKTHLMHAIGHRILEERPNAKISYITSEQFTNEFINAIANGSLVTFRQQYREADVLLIDDIQFFSGKDKSQEEFFHTFNALCDANGKQIVLTSDAPASKIKNLEQRLVSRFEWGLTAELAAPDTETRIAILHRKMKEWSVHVDSALVQFIAERIKNNVRRLEGALIRLASFASMNNRPIDQNEAEKLLRDVLRDETTRDLSIPQIQKVVADFFDVRLSDMLGRKRPAQIALARQVAMYFSREMTGASFQEIGDAFGGRDHGTVMHACRAVRTKTKTVDRLKQQVEHLASDLSQPMGR